MMYIYFAIISAVIFGVYEFLKKIALKKSSVYEVLFLHSLIAFLVSLIFIKEAINTSLIGIAFIVLKSIIVAVAWYLSLKSYDKLNVSVALPFSMLSVVFISFLSFVFFQEAIALRVIIGVVVILIGLIFISRIDGEETKKEGNNKYILLLILSYFISAFGSIIDKEILGKNHVTDGALVLYFMLFLTIIFGVIYYVKEKKLNLIKLKENYVLIFIGAGTTLSYLFYNFAVSYPDSHLGTISLIVEFYLFIAVFLAAVFLKEKNILKKVLLLIVMFIGLGLIIFI